MRKRFQVYKCEVCGNITEVLHGGVGTMICCNRPMTLLLEKTEDEGAEKHVPVIENVEGGIKVKVGSIPHPMEEDHFIEWIEVIANDEIVREYLKPNSPAESIFSIKNEDIIIREYCTVHGLWKK